MILLGICISGSCGLSVWRGNILGRKNTRVIIMIRASEIGGTDIIEGSTLPSWHCIWEILDKYVLFICI